MTASPRASKKPCPSFRSRLSAKDSPCAAARAAVSGAEDGAGDLLEAVDPVRVAGQGVDPGMAGQLGPERQEEFDVAAAAACPRTVTVVSPPESRTQGAGTGSP